MWIKKQMTNQPFWLYKGTYYLSGFKNINVLFIRYIFHGFFLNTQIRLLTTTVHFQFKVYIGILKTDWRNWRLLSFFQALNIFIFCFIINLFSYVSNIDIGNLIYTLMFLSFLVLTSSSYPFRGFSGRRMPRVLLCIV